MLETLSGFSTNVMMATWDPISAAPVPTAPLVNKIAQLSGPDFLTAAVALRNNLGWGQLALLEVFPGIGTLELYSLTPAVDVLRWSLGQGSTVILYLHVSATTLKNAFSGVVALAIPSTIDSSLFGLPNSVQSFLRQLKTAANGARILMGDIRRRQTYEKAIVAQYNREVQAELKKEQASGPNSGIYAVQGMILGTTTNGGFKISNGLLR